MFKDTQFISANLFSNGLNTVRMRREVNQAIIVTKSSECEYIDVTGVHCTVEGEHADTFVNGLALLIRTPSRYEELTHETEYNVIKNSRF